VAEGWPAGPKIEMPKTPSSGPLALGGGTAKPIAAPPLSSPLVAGPSTTPPAGTPGMTSAAPYASSTGSTPILPTAVPANASVSLGAPVSPDAVVNMTMPNAVPPPGGAAMDPVRNLTPPPTPNAAATSNDDMVQAKFTAFMDAVQRKLDEGKLADAHLALSSLYNNANLPAEQAKQITDLLDQLAGTVIYSRQHLLEPAYMTQPGDTLESISQRYSIPWQLLGRINGLLPANASNNDVTVKDKPLPPNTELKVIRGPFEAVVRLDRHELTLVLKNRYAGRFPIGVGRDQPRLDGNYTVLDKTANPTYYGPDNVTISPNDPKNPLGSAWIGLTDRIGIHGTNNPQSVGRDDNRGTISVSERDLQDLYGILSVGSRVTVTSAVR
jgi:hypothetical protein